MTSIFLLFTATLFLITMGLSAQNSEDDSDGDHVSILYASSWIRFLLDLDRNEPAIASLAEQADTSPIKITITADSPRHTDAATSYSKKLPEGISQRVSAAGEELKLIHRFSNIQQRIIGILGFEEDLTPNSAFTISRPSQKPIALSDEGVDHLAKAVSILEPACAHLLADTDRIGRQHEVASRLIKGLGLDPQYQDMFTLNLPQGPYHWHPKFERFLWSLDDTRLTPFQREILRIQECLKANKIDYVLNKEQRKVLDKLSKKVRFDKLSGDDLDHMIWVLSRVHLDMKIVKMVQDFKKKYELPMKARPRALANFLSSKALEYGERSPFTNFPYAVSLKYTYYPCYIFMDYPNIKDKTLFASFYLAIVDPALDYPGQAELISRYLITVPPEDYFWYVEIFHRFRISLEEWNLEHFWDIVSRGMKPYYTILTDEVI
ncbi:MAG: hypothetical protein JSR85_02400 [Proteobacteria bacterium]|nr:hypothetical protein [Pseudomonadota bacterium]